MPSSCKHHQNEDKGTLVVEVRHFNPKEDKDITSSPHFECSLCFVENVNRRSQKVNRSAECHDYFKPPHVYDVTIQRPTSYEELQNFLSVVIPKDFGPTILERSDGSAISPNSCTFQEGERISFRELRPSTQKDFDMKRLYRKFNELDANYFDKMIAKS